MEMRGTDDATAAIVGSVRSEHDKFSVLLVEDQDCEAELIALAYRTGGYDVDLRHFSMGRDCIEHLRTTESLPALILVDLNLPDISGIDIVRFIRAEPRLRGIPIAMLTGSEADRDLHDAFAAGVNSYIVKSPDIDELFAQVHVLTDRFI